jgi:3',5'-cyclic AMP phosphodiesterase CpdA
VSAPVLIAQISDLHIKPPRQLAYGRVDTAAALERCIAHLLAFRPRPDFAVISGDLVDAGTDAEYAHLLRLLAPLDLPFAAIPGNHDSREPMRRAFPSHPYAHPAGPLDQLHTVRGLDLLLLDSSVPGAPHGLLETGTLHWLDRTLAATDRPAMLFLHHPPFASGIWHMDRQNLRNADQLEALVRCHPRVRHVACGHVHRATMTTFAGTVASICPAPNHAVALDLDHLLAPSFMIEPPAFHLHAWFPDKGGPESGSLVTHLVPIGGFDGPHPFFDHAGKLL